MRSAIFINNPEKKVRGLGAPIRHPSECIFGLIFEGQKEGKKRSIFPVKKRNFPLLNDDFEVQLIVLKMPLGLCKIPPLYSPFFPKIEKT